MPRRRSVVLPTRSFATQTAAIAFFKTMLGRYQPGTRVSDADALDLAALLERHDEYTTKVGCGVDHFEVMMTEHGTPCFRIVRTDGTGTDFSYPHCVTQRPPTRKQEVSQAFRRVVRFDLYKARDDFFTVNKDVSNLVACAETGERIGRDQAHMDHRAPMTFEVIVTTFLAGRGLSVDMVPITTGRDDQVSPEITDPALADAFRRLSRSGGLVGPRREHRKSFPVGAAAYEAEPDHAHPLRQSMMTKAFYLKTCFDVLRWPYVGNLDPEIFCGIHSDIQVRRPICLRASDIWALDDHVAKESRKRLDNCHIYMLCKRPRLSLLPGTLEFGSRRVSFQVECKIAGGSYRANFSVAREAFLLEEHTFEVSAYPHRELISRDQDGQIIVETLPATFAHLIRELPDEARDLEVMYIGKGLSKSAQDRLKQHETLQRILGDINSHDPDDEVFVLVYAFKYTKDLTAFSNLRVEISGEAAKRHRRKAIDYRPSLEEQVALIEATCIGHFQPNRYNTHYLDFPKRHYRILKPIYAADFAAILVQLDNANIGGQRIYSRKIAAASDHRIVIDFRAMEDKTSLLIGAPDGSRRGTLD